MRAVTIIIDGFWWGCLLLAACAAGRWWLVAVAAFVVNVGVGGSNSLMLIGSVAAALSLFDGFELTRVLRVQAAVVYGFAAVNKLWPSFSSGGVLRDVAPWVPYPQQAAGLVIFTEMLLAVAVVRLWPVAFPLAVCAHVAFTLGVATGTNHVAGLAAFNGIMVLLVWTVTPRSDAALMEPPRPP